MLKLAKFEEYMKTILECMCGISEKMRVPDERGLVINDVTSKKAASELRTLRKVLGMTTMQVLILTAIIQQSSRFRIDGDDISTYLGMDYLRFLMHESDLEELRKRGYIRIDTNGNISVPRETLKNLTENKPVEPETLTGLSTAKILTRLKKILSIRDNDEMTTGEVYESVSELLKANPDTSIARACAKYLKNITGDEAVVMFALIYRYWFERDDMVVWEDLDDYFDEDDLDELRAGYRVGDLALQKRGVIVFSGEDGIMSRDYFRLADNVTADVFEDVGGVRKKEVKISASRKMEAASISRKDLFYNPEEGGQVAQLKGLLSEKSFDGIRARMKGKGLRSGFTCLFYGSPGTGKTETVYQIARECGRDLFIVDVSQIKSCWVGESEKNIKDVFDRYRACVNAGERIPILLFNEADAIFGIRQQGAERAVDKMENSIQNIILQEMEDLDGILIATTNLTENLDKAFERRFLYKVRFERPSVEVKSRIWKSMLPDLSDADAAYLASKFSLSGGQIENVARKKTVQSILSGVEPALEDLIRYCCEEEIGAAGERRRIGFQA